MANLITTITESLTLNGAQQGGTTTQTITGINHVFKRIVTCVDDTDFTIATFQTATSTGDGAIDLEDVKYIRVTNLETTHPCNLSLQIAGGEGGSANMSSSHLLQAGESFILGTPDDFMRGEADTSPGFGSYEDLDTILARPTTSNHIRVAVFVATV